MIFNCCTCYLQEIYEQSRILEEAKVRNAPFACIPPAFSLSCLRKQLPEKGPRDDTQDRDSANDEPAKESSHLSTSDSESEFVASSTVTINWESLVKFFGVAKNFENQTHGIFSTRGILTS